MDQAQWLGFVLDRDGLRESNYYSVLKRDRSHMSVNLVVVYDRYLMMDHRLMMDHQVLMPGYNPILDRRLLYHYPMTDRLRWRASCWTTALRWPTPPFSGPSC